ncbi:MAG: hypothetical protein V7629_07730 [Motiliproteus sp.]
MNYPNSGKWQRGVGLVGAIFVITIMAVIVAGVSSLVATGQRSYSDDIMSTRARLAAASAAQLALFKVANEPVSACVDVADGALLSPVALSNNCTAAARCASFFVAATQTRYFTLRAQGVCGQGIDRAVHDLTLQASRTIGP